VVAAAEEEGQAVEVVKEKEEEEEEEAPQPPPQQSEQLQPLPPMITADEDGPSDGTPRQWPAPASAAAAAAAGGGGDATRELEERAAAAEARAASRQQEVEMLAAQLRQTILEAKLHSEANPATARSAGSAKQLLDKQLETAVAAQDDDEPVVGSIALPRESQDEGDALQLLERRAARAAQLEAQLALEAETLTAQLTEAILAKKASSESAIKGRKQTGGVFGFLSPGSKPKKK
jgi:hypothetical protein